MDLIIHFPTGDIKRNFHQNAADLDHDFLGTADWRSIVKAPKDGHKPIDVLRSQLLTVGYIGEDVLAVAVENAKQTVMYHLVFASSEESMLGDKIWDSITRTTARGQTGWGF